MREQDKIRLLRLLCGLGVHRLFRRLNRQQLAILCYHGVYDGYTPAEVPLYTHIPVEAFRSQMRYLKENYHVISLRDLEDTLAAGASLPDHAALVTFDDGFENNYSVAFPVLKELGLPASIFLCVDYVGTGRLLWFDELFLVLAGLRAQGGFGDRAAALLEVQQLPDTLAEAYPRVAEAWKRRPVQDRERLLAGLRRRFDLRTAPLARNFRLLNWEQVREMSASGLVDFGVHTATHRLLRELEPWEFEREILAPKATLERMTGQRATAFCYPNGIPDVDFTLDHEQYLESAGYTCAFSTGATLNSARSPRFRLGRLTVGDECSSASEYFKLNLSGFLPAAREQLRGGWRPQPQSRTRC